MKQAVKDILSFLGWTLLGLVLFGEFKSYIPLVVCVVIGFISMIIIGD